MIFTERTQTGRVFSRLFICWIICCGFSPENVFWKPLSLGIQEHEIKAVSIAASDSPLAAPAVGRSGSTSVEREGGSSEKQSASSYSTIFAATDRGVYRRTGSSTVLEHILTFEIGGQHAYSLYTQQNFIAVATAQGFWESHDRGEHWVRSFNPANALHRRCYDVFKRGDVIFIATAQGLFYKNVSQNMWHRPEGGLGRQPVFDIEGSESGIFVAAEDGVYYATLGHQDTKTPENQLLGHGLLTMGHRQDEILEKSIVNSPSSIVQFKKIFSIISNDSGDDHADTDTNTFTDTIYNNRFIRAIAYDHSTLFVATKRGIWRLAKGAETPQQIPSNSIPLHDIQDVKVIRPCLTSHGRRAPDHSHQDSGEKPGPALFLATHQGVFIFQRGQWSSIYRGLATNHINDLAINRHGHIFVATDRGIFHLNESAPQMIDYDSAKKKFQHEPSVQKVQKMVIAYADVGKKKIDAWKDQARLKAFLPSVSLDFDRDVSDLYHWNTGASPDELQKGVAAVDWGIGLKWDLADVIWSTDQTSIDSRSKLMVELRDDLVNQASRIYFERRRLQIELLQSPDDDPTRWQKEMRIEELTAGLDGMTGGLFSRRICK